LKNYGHTQEKPDPAAKTTGEKKFCEVNDKGRISQTFRGGLSGQTSGRKGKKYIWE